MSKLLIVESPSKIKTLKKILGRGYDIAASNGHVMDLPKSKLGIDVDHDFSPSYVVIDGKEKILKDLKSLAKKSESVILASDPDREGESIAWHIANYIEAPKKIMRITFNEITEKVVREALESPRELDMKRVNAQQTRRLLDRLVGYKISPVLWKVLGFNTSAGRVQSVALRLVCDLEDKIKAFKPEKYWEVSGIFDKKIDLALHKVGKEKGSKVKDKKILDGIKKEVGNSFEVETFKVKGKVSSPPLPFETSTLQQLASSKLGFSPSRTMRVAQKLYEGIDIGGEHKGLITYMRTDSTRVSGEARGWAKDLLKKEFGSQYVGTKIKVEKGKGKVQDAHECIRPTYPMKPSSLRGALTPEQHKLYELIFDRFIVSQMADLSYDQLEVMTVKGSYHFRGLFNKIKFDGYYRVYKDGMEDFEKPFPKCKEGDKLTLDDLMAKEGETKPPARYSEASLIKKLKAEGIGRPSTYATIVETLKKREYAELKDKKFVPTSLGFSVKGELVEHFANIMDLKFTVKMEELLDKIASGEEKWQDTMKYFHDDLMKHLKKFEVEAEALKNKRVGTDVKCVTCDGEMVLKSGRYGHYLECEKEKTHRKSLSSQTIDHDEIKKGFVHLADTLSEVEKERAGIPTDVKYEDGTAMILKNGRYGYYLECEDKVGNRQRKSLPKGIKIEGAMLSSKKIKLAAQITQIERDQERILKSAGPCEKCGSPMVIKKGKWGQFLGCSKYPDCKNMKKVPKDK